MKAIIDGLIYQRQEHGGISRIYREILPRMCDFNESLRVTLFTTGSLRQELPQHARIAHRRLFPVDTVLRPGRLWRGIRTQLRRWVLTRATRGESNGIWHSTYYTRPTTWGGKEVVTVHDMIHERFPDLFDGGHHDAFRKQKRDAILEGDAVICVSETTRDDLLHYYPVEPAQTHVVPNACSGVFRKLNDGTARIEGPTAKPFLLYVGRRSHYKNFRGLVRAYSGWQGRGEFDLVVVGRPWKRKEIDVLDDLQIADRVHLMAGIPDHELARLYNQAAAFVFPSLYEGFGIPLLEAMACGCPIVASDIPSTREVAGGLPYYFDPAETGSLIEALERACSEGRGSERLRQGLRHVRGYSWDETASRTLEVYRALSNVE